MIFGECLCGNVTFSCEFKTDNINIYQCHCHLCKKQTGSSSNSATIVETKQFNWIKKDGISKWQKETGFSSHFCGNCGCSVPNTFADNYCWIPIGLLDIDSNVNHVKVVAHFCLNSKSSWHELSGSPEKFDELPEFKTIMTLLDGPK